MKTKFVAVFALIIILLFAFVSSQSSSQDLTHHYLIKLYAGDKVIGSWQSREIGRIEGESLTFVIKENFEVKARQVRIHGVYTVEEFE